MRTRCPSRSTSTPATFPSSTRIDSTGLDSQICPPWASIASASASQRPMVPCGWKPNRLKAL
jgi:hypothetical protein